MKVLYNLHFPIYFSTTLLFRLLLSLAFTLFVTISLSAQCTDNQSQINDFKIKFVDVRYDFPEEGQSTWYYTVKAISCKPVNRITFPLNKCCIDVLDAGTWCGTLDDLNSGGGRPRIGRDNRARTWGVKFRKKIKPYKKANYYFTLNKNVTIEEVEKLAIKSGCRIYKGKICGPSSDCMEIVEEKPEPTISCISGRAFDDVNRNGIRDADEGPLSGLIVSLYYEFGIWGTVETDENGNYSFCDLEAQTYGINMETPTSYFQTIPNVGLDEFDSDLIDQGFSDLLIINEVGEHIENVDGGFFTNGGADSAFAVMASDTPRTLKDSNIPDQIISVESEIVERSNIDIQIYPNPVVREVTIKKKNQSSHNVFIEIRDFNLGFVASKIISESEYDATFDLSSLPNGIYYVNIVSDSKSSIKQIVKMD